MRITYQFPRSADSDLVHVISLIGLDRGEYVPMMWETCFASAAETTYFDFKYTYQNHNWGLNKPAILTKQDLSEMFSLYRQLRDFTDFP